MSSDPLAECLIKSYLEEPLGAPFASLSAVVPRGLTSEWSWMGLVSRLFNGIFLYLCGGIVLKITHTILEYSALCMHIQPI